MSASCLRAILIELMYRDRGSLAAGVPYVTPPDWLVEGLLALQPGRALDNDANFCGRLSLRKG